MRSAPFIRVMAVLTAVMLLLFSVTFPVARALDPVTISAGIVAVSATIAIGSILVGLGVLPGTDVTAFNVLIEDIKTGLGDAWTYTTTAGATMIKMLSLGSNYYAQHDLVAQILSMLHGAGVLDTTWVLYGHTVSDDGKLWVGDTQVVFPWLDYARFTSVLDDGYTYCYFNGSATAYRACLFDSPMDLMLNDDGSYCVVGPATYHKFNYYSDGSYGYVSWQNPYTLADGSSLSVFGVIPIVQGYVADNFSVADLGTSLDDDIYITWTDSEILSVNVGVGFDPDDPTAPTDPNEISEQKKYLPLLLSEPGALALGTVTQAITQLGGYSQLAPTDVIDLGELVELDPETVPDDLKNTDTNPDTGTDATPDVETDYLTTKLNALREQFPFVESIIVTAQALSDAIDGDLEPPVIYVDFSASPSETFGNEKILLTDFSWYAPYKEDMDAFLSAAMWAFFSWRVFLRLPGIIGGESAYLEPVSFRREDEIQSLSVPDRNNSLRKR